MFMEDNIAWLETRIIGKLLFPGLRSIYGRSKARWEGRSLTGAAKNNRNGQRYNPWVNLNRHASVDVQPRASEPKRASFHGHQ